MGKNNSAVARAAWAITAVASLGASGFAAQAAPPPLEAYGDLPAVEQLAISPSGKQLASVSRIHNVRTLVVGDMAGDIKAQAPVGDSKVRGLQFAGEDIVLLHNSATSSLGPEFTASLYEFSGTLIVPLTGGQPQLVFSRTLGIGGIVAGTYGVRQTPTGMKGYFGGIAMDVNKTGISFVNGHPTLYEVDLAHNSARKIAPAGSGTHARTWLVDYAGRVAATFEISTDTGKWQLEGSGGTVIASGQDRTGDVRLVGLGSGGTSVIYGTRDPEGLTLYFEVPLSGGVPKQVLAGQGIDTLYFDQGTGRLLGYLVDAEQQQRPVMFDPATQTAANKIFKAFRKYRTELIDWTPDFSRVIVHTRGNGDSGTYYSVDVAALKADPVGYERPRISPEDGGADLCSGLQGSRWPGHGRHPDAAAWARSA